MASRVEILDTLNQWLTPESFQDYCPNGLQVEGSAQVNRIISGVTASQALIDAAAARWFRRRTDFPGGMVYRRGSGLYR